MINFYSTIRGLSRQPDRPVVLRAYPRVTSTWRPKRPVGRQYANVCPIGCPRRKGIPHHLDDWGHAEDRLAVLEGSLSQYCRVVQILTNNS